MKCSSFIMIDLWQIFSIVGIDLFSPKITFSTFEKSTVQEIVFFLCSVVAIQRRHSATEDNQHFVRATSEKWSRYTRNFENDSWCVSTESGDNIQLLRAIFNGSELDGNST